MSDITIEILLKIFTPLIPIIALIIGGQTLIDKYAIKRKRKELEIELLKKTREEKYNTIRDIYNLFSEYMRLYRKINSPLTDLNNAETLQFLFNEVVITESKVEGIILKVGCEFVTEKDDKEEIEGMLGNLRQSVQIWREKLINKEKLPFNSSGQEDYMRFKTAFAYTAAFMANKIHEDLETPDIKMKRVEEILVGSFDNKYEKWNQGEFDKKHQFKKYYHP